jgi:hypothetical protein
MSHAAADNRAPCQAADATFRLPEQGFVDWKDNPERCQAIEIQSGDVARLTIEAKRAAKYSHFPQLTVATTPHPSDTNHDQRGGILMTSRIPPLSFEHQAALGRPSCPRCGQLCLFPERMEYSPGRVRNSWQCDGCSERFQTSVMMPVVADQKSIAA